MSDVAGARGLALTYLEKAASIDAGRVSAVVVFADGTIDRRRMLHGQAVRLLLRQVHADVERLRAIGEACRARRRHLRLVEPPDLHHEVDEVAAQLADAAEGIVRAAGMPPDADPVAREAVMAEADLWLAHLERGGRRRQRRARLRRRVRLAVHAVTR